jgi:uncharacterized protein
MSTIEKLSPAEVIRILELMPRSAGGHSREVLRQPVVVDGDCLASTAMYFLLAGAEPPHCCRVDAIEIWHFYAGAPLELQIRRDEDANQDEDLFESLVLGTDLVAGQRPQIVVEAHVWLSTKSLGDWTLCGCTVEPGFDSAKFELVPKAQSPRRRGIK